MGWLSTDWKYRKKFTISRASGAVTNYQFPLKVYYGSGTDGTEAVEGITAGKLYCNSLCQADFDDIRVTNSDGSTLMDIWLESKTDSNNAVFWIEHDSIGTGATTFYVYYGNAAAASVSNGANTFITFENFEWGNNTDPLTNDGGSVDWTRDQAADPTISTEQQYTGTRSGKFQGVAGYSLATFADIPSDNKALRFRVYKETASANSPNVAQSNGTKRWNIYVDVSENLLYWDGASKDTLANITADAWQLIEVNDFVWASGTYDIWLNGSEVKADATMENSADVTNKIRFGGIETAATRDVYFDNIIVRNFRAVEPAWGSWGTWETVPLGGSVCFDMAVV